MARKDRHFLFNTTFRPRRQGGNGGAHPATAVAALLAATAVGAVWPSAAAAVDELDYGLADSRLDRVELRGNQVFGDGALKKILDFEEATWLRPLSLARYRPHLIEARLRLLEKYYRRNGYHQVSVQLDSVARHDTERGDILYISVREGSRTTVRQVVFTGDQPLPEAQLRARLRIREGEAAPADLNDLGGEVYALRSLFWDLAYLTVDIQPSLATAVRPDSLGGLADLEYHIDAGPRFTVGRIDIEGARATRPELIRRELRVAAGEEFSWARIEQSRRNLLDTALFRDVGFEPLNLDPTARTADLSLRVVERQPAYYELGAGIGSHQLVRLLAAWGHHNLWGTGRRLTLRGRVYWNIEEIQGGQAGTSPELNYRADLLYINPHIAGSNRPLEVTLFKERDTRGESALNLQTLGFSLGTRVRPHTWLEHRLLLQVEETDPQLHPDASADLAERFGSDVWKSQTRSWIYSLEADRRNNPFRPSRGRLYTGQLQLAGGLLAGDNSFVRAETGWHGYTSTPLGGVLAFRVAAGGIWPFGGSAAAGADGIPYADRFFAGGVSTVRGYVENGLGPQISTSAELDELTFQTGVPIYADPARGGTYRLLTNVEWRFGISRLGGWNLAGVLFADGGNVWERVEDIRLVGFRLRSRPREPGFDDATRIWDYRYSVGTGVRLETPFGPFRLDVGFPLKRALYVSQSERQEDDKLMVHFSLGYPF